MLVTEVGEEKCRDNYKILVTVLAILVTNIHYLYQRRSPTSLSPTKSGQWLLLRFNPWPCALTSALLATAKHSLELPMLMTDRFGWKSSTNGRKVWLAYKKTFLDLYLNVIFSLIRFEINTTLRSCLKELIIDRLNYCR